MVAAGFGLEQARAVLPPRTPDAHKHQARVLVVAGSRDYLGAALLCVRAAYRSGAGYVQLALPQDLALAAMAALPEAVVLALPCEGRAEEAQSGQLLELASLARAAVVGPGLGRTPGALALARRLWLGLPCPAVFDADALVALEPGPVPIHGRVLTPHEGELKALLGPDSLNRGREAAALALARGFGAVGLLKGPGTLVASAEGRLTRCLSGGPVLATAGSGDVLAGLIAGLLAQGAGIHEAAALGAWVHGRAGELWAAGHAGRGLLASDLADHIPRALKEAGA